MGSQPSVEIRSGGRISSLALDAGGTLTEDARRRLEVIQRFVELGSGFSIASHDLEIRGGGNLLGPQQSGHIAAIGFEMYTELLGEAVQQLQAEQKGEAVAQAAVEPEIKLAFAAFLSERYVPDVQQRISLYRRLSATTTDPEIDRIERELVDRFGTPPPEGVNLLWVIRIKLLLKDFGIASATFGNNKASLTAAPNSRLDPARAVALVASRPSDFQWGSDSKLVVKIPTDALPEIHLHLGNALELIANAPRHC